MQNRCNIFIKLFRQPLVSIPCLSDCLVHPQTTVDEQTVYVDDSVPDTDKMQVMRKSKFSKWSHNCYQSYLLNSVGDSSPLSTHWAYPAQTPLLLVFIWYRIFKNQFYWKSLKMVIWVSQECWKPHRLSQDAVKNTIKNTLSRFKSLS